MEPIIRMKITMALLIYLVRKKNENFCFTFYSKYNIRQVKNITAISIVLGVLNLNSCDILQWPPIDGSIPKLEKCYSEFANFSTYVRSCHNTSAPIPYVSTNIDCLLAKECLCVFNNPSVNDIFSYGSYLYPASIEFSILVGRLFK